MFIQAVCLYVRYIRMEVTMKSCLQTLRNIRNDCLWDWKRLLAFEIVYKLFGGLVLLPFFQLLIRKSLDFSGLQYLNMQVLFSWIQRPFSILTVVLVLLLLGLYVFYEIIFLVFYYEHAWNKQVFTLPGLLITCLQQVRRTLHPKNWSILLTILCLLPFSVLLLKPSSLSGIRIPEYFIDFLREAGTKYYAAYLLALLLINLLAFYMLHVIAVFLLQDKSFRTAFQECRLLLKKRKCRLLLQNLIMMAVVGIFLLLVYAFAIALLVLFADKENTASNRTAFLLTICNGDNTLIFCTQSFCSVSDSLSCCIISKASAGIRKHEARQEKEQFPGSRFCLEQESLS